MLRRRRLASLALLPLLGCEPSSENRAGRQIDAEWHRRAALEGHVAPWFAHAPRPDGSFHVNFGRDWTAKTGQNIEVTHHARLVYAMTAGYELSQDRRYLEAAYRGADYLLNRFADKVQGGFFHVLSPAGKVVADFKRCYGHAFVLFALAELFRVSQEPRFKEAALLALQHIETGLADPLGGYRAHTARNFVPGGRDSRSQNPLMHMFEAQLALLEATGDPAARAAARRLGDFVVNQLLQGLPDGTAQIPEWYDAFWKPLTTKEAGAYTDIGHQFEWSHLLVRSTALDVSQVHAPIADRLLDYALKQGYDEIDGGAISQVYPDQPAWKSKGWWQQAECLRALIVHATTSGRKELWRRYDQTLGLIRDELVDPQQGGWLPGVCKRSGCEDVQPDPYHMLGMHLAAIKAAGR
ncbi:AGE family epimerase/isomerase [Pelomonas sp. SE-A7]|uniref:AGE family epimerase/isomerase n=1 Tax=Pelomonas sp. SE-A7 TaxID=3054953 RepID=UPI00259C9212|nr:AGE family epimerase/isomerase [Pelomonas sp. SE-A7]MDM4768448.1 AGE family epimerase/isomerase [Pelomonas sp. SE-A7]